MVAEEIAWFEQRWSSPSHTMSTSKWSNEQYNLDNKGSKSWSILTISWLMYQSVIRHCVDHLLWYLTSLVFRLNLYLEKDSLMICWYASVIIFSSWFLLKICFSSSVIKTFFFKFGVFFGQNKTCLKQVSWLK